MNKHIIIVGTDLKHMMQYGNRIAFHYKAALFVEHRSQAIMLQGSSSVIFTTDRVEADRWCNLEGVSIMSFADVAQAINDAIPLTDWIPASIEPTIPGWYARDWGVVSEANCWFDSVNWFYNDECCEPSNNGRSWRGLSQEPIRVTP